MHTRSDINRKQIVVITLDYNKITDRFNKGAPSTQVPSTNINRGKRPSALENQLGLWGTEAGSDTHAMSISNSAIFCNSKFWADQCRLRLACNIFITKRVDFYPVPATWPNRQGNQDGVQTQNRNQRKLHNTGSKDIYMVNDPDRRT